MIITIRVPDDATALQYNSQDESGYEMWKTVKFSEIISVQAEQDAGNT